MGDEEQEPQEPQEPTVYFLPTTPLTAVCSMLSNVTGWCLSWRQHRNPVSGDKYIHLAVVRVEELVQ